MKNNKKKCNNFRLVDYKVDDANQYITPHFFKDDFKTFCFIVTCDYFHLLSITLESIKSNVSDNKEILIFVDDATEFEINKLLSSFQEDEKFYFTFIKVTQNQNLDIFMKWAYNKKWKPINFYKMFLFDPIFKDFKKILYLDCDLIVAKDISDLFKLDFNGNLIAGVQDFVASNIYLSLNSYNHPSLFSYECREKFLSKNLNFNFYNYITNHLNIDNKKYLNGGVLLFNCQEKNDDLYLTKNWMKDLLALEQDMLNVLLKDKKIVLNPVYDYCIDEPWKIDDIKGLINSSNNKNEKLSWFNAYKNFKIFHFYISVKPWNCSIRACKKKNPSYLLWYSFAKQSNYWKTIKKIKRKSRNKKILFLMSFKWLSKVLFALKKYVFYLHSKA